MIIDEKLKCIEIMCGIALRPYQRILLTNLLNMTNKERDKQIMYYYACRRPISLRDYWPISLYSNSYYGTTGITNSNANAEAIKINQRRHAKGLRWSVEIK